ncbi:hypothetical protein PHLCEN_2v12357 [Hermanssonia centrifuga]|uniref:Uncharacterized protein n=1 Tax=Hermanssonia centrifuga TaxID=98765 RepID=A0A2R6NHF2_9APHY|nr:hypothetical protein PHLCEN_2v12357 [Hermanssonia centrifuga]
MYYGRWYHKQSIWHPWRNVRRAYTRYSFAESISSKLEGSKKNQGIAISNANITSPRSASSRTISIAEFGLMTQQEFMANWQCKTHLPLPPRHPAYVFVHALRPGDVHIR